MEVKIQHGIGYIEVEINIGKIESDIWPSRHLDDRNVWNNSSDDLPHPVLEIPTLISTHATLDIVVEENIDNSLPRVPQFRHQDKSLGP